MTTFRRTTFALAAVACSLAALAGCSKSDDTSASSTTTTAAPMTKDAFVTAANAACKTAVDKLDSLNTELSAKYGDNPTADQIKEAGTYVSQQLGPVLDTTMTTLKGLTPPADAQAMWKTGLDKLQAASDGIKTDAVKTLGGTPFDYQAGYDYGLNVCFTASKPTMSSVASAIS